MLVHEFDELMENQPFKPFEIHTSDGRSLLVKSPEFAWHPPTSRTIWVASGKGDGRVHMIDLHLVAQFIVHEGNGHGRPGKRKNGK
jgi:hypothetical protein